jgi:hypothetical protein
MRSLLARVAFLVGGAVVGLGLYALGVGGALVVPLAVAAALVIGELSLFVAGDGA